MNDFVLTQEEDRKKDRKLQIERLSVQYVLMDQFDRLANNNNNNIVLIINNLLDSNFFRLLAWAHEHRF